ncbi:MAG TPA: hypothetical protein VJC15_00640 [Candidatus Paceibacterota bacterium]
MKQRHKQFPCRPGKANKGIAPIAIIIVVVALLGVGAGGFILVSKNKTPEATPSPSPQPSFQKETVFPPGATNQKTIQSEQATLALVKVSSSGVCLKHNGGKSINSYLSIEINGQSASIISFGRFPSITDLTFDSGEAFVYAIQSPAIFKAGDKIRAIDDEGTVYPYVSDGRPDYWVVKDVISEEGWAQGAPGTAPFRWADFVSCP